MINTTYLFHHDDFKEVAKCSDFNKRIGPDCFYGNTLNFTDQLNDNELFLIT